MDVLVDYDRGGGMGDQSRLSKEARNRQGGGVEVNPDVKSTAHAK